MNGMNNLVQKVFVYLNEYEREIKQITNAIQTIADKEKNKKKQKEVVKKESKETKTKKKQKKRKATIHTSKSKEEN